MDGLKSGVDTLFLLIGAVMVLAMHAGFAFLELGTVRKKNQVNALVKILVDFSVSTLAYFFIGYTIAYGVEFFDDIGSLSQHNGYALVRFFFLLTFAAAIPAIVSGGIAERAKFNPQLVATMIIVGFIYPFFEGIAWNERFGVQAWLTHAFGAPFHDFAGSVVVHASAAGSRCRPCCCSAHATAAMRRTAALPRIRRRTFRSSRSARGCWRSAGSAST